MSCVCLTLGTISGENVDQLSVCPQGNLCLQLRENLPGKLMEMKLIICSIDLMVRLEGSRYESITSPLSILMCDANVAFAGYEEEKR